MAGLFSSDSNDLLTRITQERQQANQALGAPYGKYSGIVSTGAGLADIGADAMRGGGVGASDPRMQQMNEVKNIFAQVGMQVGNTSSPEFYKALAQAFTQKGFADQAQKASDKAAEVEKAGMESELLKENLKAKQLSADKEANMRKDLSALPPDATDDQIRSVIMKYGDANTIINDLTRRDNAKIAAETKRQAAQMLALQKQQMAQQKLANMPKDVAEMIASNALLQTSSANLDQYIPMLEGVKDKNGNVVQAPTVDFSLKGKSSAWLDSFSGNPDKATLQMGQIKKAISQQVQLILQAAKGTQTEGDAKRAAENIVTALEGNSNAGIAQAIKDVQALQKRTMGSNNAYVEARGYGDRISAATPATAAPTSNRRPLSEFNK